MGDLLENKWRVRRPETCEIGGRQKERRGRARGRREKERYGEWEGMENEAENREECGRG